MSQRVAIQNEKFVILFNTNNVDDWLPKKMPAVAISITRDFNTFKSAAQWGQTTPQVAEF